MARTRQVVWVPKRSNLGVVWALKRSKPGGVTPVGQWYIQYGRSDSKMVEVCPTNGDGTMNVYTMTRRDARLLAKRINQMLDETRRKR